MLSKIVVYIKFNKKWDGIKMSKNWLDEYLKIKKGDGIQFEKFIADLFSEYHEAKVKIIGKTNDKGVDLIINNNIGVQVKFYSTPLGIKPIQEIHAGMHYYDLDEGMVITNSSYNINAIEFAKKVGIKLIDGNDILVMINDLSLDRKSPKIENDKKLIQNENHKEGKQYVRYKSKKKNRTVAKRKKFEMKINDYNLNERENFIYTIEQIYELSKSNPKLNRQIFNKMSTIYEIDTYENKKKIDIITVNNELNPKLWSSAYIYPTNAKYDIYLKILEQDVSDTSKLNQVLNHQFKEVLSTLFVIGILPLIIYYILELL